MVQRFRFRVKLFLEKLRRVVVTYISLIGGGEILVWVKAMGQVRGNVFEALAVRERERGGGDGLGEEGREDKGLRRWKKWWEGAEGGGGRRKGQRSGRRRRRGGRRVEGIRVQVVSIKWWRFVKGTCFKKLINYIFKFLFLFRF